MIRRQNTVIGKMFQNWFIVTVVNRHVSRSPPQYVLVRMFQTQRENAGSCDL